MVETELFRMFEGNRRKVDPELRGIVFLLPLIRISFSGNFILYPIFNYFWFAQFPLLLKVLGLLSAYGGAVELIFLLLVLILFL